MNFDVNPRDPDFYQNPYPVYDEMRALGRCFYWASYGHICFPHYKEVNALLRDRRFGRQISHVMPTATVSLHTPLDRFEANSLLEKEPPEHTRLRRLVNRAFVSRQVEIQRPRIETLAHELIDQLQAAGNEGELLRGYAEVIPVIVICELLGVSTDMATQLLAWSHQMVAIYEHGADAAVRAQANLATAHFQDFIDQAVEEKRQHPGDDLLTLLIEAEEAGEKLSADELSATCILLLNAGHEATVHGIGNGVKAILESGIQPPDWLGGGEPSRALVEETLRFDAPLHMFTRYVLEDLEYAGQTFKQGDVVGLMLGAANRDPLKFANPDAFDPRRGGVGHTSLGAGIHFCVGAPLARLELEVALPVLFERLPALQLAETPRYADRYHFHGLEALNVRW